VFTACGEKKTNSDEAKTEVAVTATSVKFSKIGKYTTSVSSEKVDLSGITAENIEVRYADPYANALTVEELQATAGETADTAESSGTEAETSLEETFPLVAKVDSVKANDKGGFDIAFTDENAAEYVTSDYIIRFEGKEEVADVEVEFPEITLTPDIDSLASNAKEAKVTLTVDGSEFEDSVGENDIFLDNAFSDMTVESVSASGKNLTVQLKGSPARNVADAYQWGSINVKPTGIKDGYTDVTAKVNIQLESAYLDAATLKYENKKINVDLKVYGVADVDALNKDNVKIDGADVEAVEKTDENTAKLTISADGIQSANDFVDSISGKEMSLGDYKIETGLSQASFYPIFDYAEEDGDNLKLTFKLYANNGAFDKELKADAISFADDFEGAKAESVTVEDDTLATLIISVPANGQTIETMDMRGTVTLSEGSLINSWGDKASKEASYTRNYSGETLGREVTLNAETLLEIQKYTRGKNTLFGKVLYWGGVAGKVFSVAKTVLEFTGVLKSEHQQEMEAIAELGTKLNTVIDNQYKIMDTLNKLKNDIKEGHVEPYRENIENLNTAIINLSDVFANGALFMALEDAVRAGKLNAIPSFAGLKDAALKAEKEKYKELYVPNMDDMTDEQIREYNVRLVKWIRDNKSSIDKYGTAFESFETRYNELYSLLKATALQLSRTDGTNPLSRYDEICAMKYNFDSQCYDFRLSLRETARVLLAKGLGLVAYYNMIEKYPSNSDFNTVKDNVIAATKRIDAMSTNIGHPASQINPSTNAANSVNFISDVILTCANTYRDSEKISGELMPQGYSFTNSNLMNAPTYFTGIGDTSMLNYPYVIYLGYKTTTNYNDAIKNFAIVKGKRYYSPEKTVDIDGVTYTLAPAEGFDGNFNKGSNRDKLYLYYTKEEQLDKKAVSADGIDFSSKRTSADSPDVNIHKEYTPRYLNYERKTEMFCPYSYVFGKKIAIWDTGSISNYNDFGGAIKQGSGYRNWSDSEIRDFTNRMQYDTLKDELKSAGIDIRHALILNISWKKQTSWLNQWNQWTYRDYSGEVINTNAKNKSGVSLGLTDIARTDGNTYRKIKNLDVTYIEFVG
ncbi:MAG: hypothetical protein IJL81_01785, partial [Clostridia bacterium]|nr:hypothetical protein [Clostridia bacterium]